MKLSSLEAAGFRHVAQNAYFRATGLALKQ